MSRQTLDDFFGKKVFMVCLIVMSFLNLMPVAAQGKWQTFESKEAAFSVLLPGTAILMEKMVSTPAGDFLVHTVFTESSTDSTGNFLYLVNYFEVKNVDLSPDSSFDAFVFLEDFMENIRVSVNGTVLYSHRDHFDKNPVLEYRLNYQDDQLQMKGRILSVGQMLYSLQVFTDKKNSLNRNMDVFLKSIKLLKPE